MSDNEGKLSTTIINQMQSVVDITRNSSSYSDEEGEPERFEDSSESVESEYEGPIEIDDPVDGDKRVFKLKNFSPICFIVPKYPVEHCQLCRGDLIEVCGDCASKSSIVCSVTEVDGHHYHAHCYNLIKPKAVAKN